MKVSIVVPVMNESGNVHLLLQKLFEVLERYDSFEIILVDDGSTDDTFAQINSCVIPDSCKNRGNVRCLSFSRNFGHQHALKCGLDAATGDCIISMDGDLQHPPEMIPTLIDKWQETKCNIVFTIRQDDPTLSFFKRFTSKSFYYLINAVTSLKLNPGSADFRLIDRKVQATIKTLKEPNIFFRGMVNWIGYSQVGIPYMPEQRHWGKTKYTLKKMLKFAETGITSFSTLPLKLSFAPAVLFILGFIAATILNFKNIIKGDNSAITLSVVLLACGILFLVIHMLSKYIGIIYEEQKGRPAYIVKEDVTIE